MKRDMETVRSLLIQIEKDNKGTPIQITNEDIKEDQLIQYHLKIMIDAGLVEGKSVGTFDGTHTLISGLTWEGHDFLDAARNDKVWKKADEVAKKEGTRLNDLSFEVAKSLLVSSAKQLFNLQ